MIMLLEEHGLADIRISNIEEPQQKYLRRTVKTRFLTGILIGVSRLYMAIMSTQNLLRIATI